MRADALDAALLGAFAQADGGFVSGNDLAARYGITRPAVWARLRKLEACGYAFEAVRNRGYRLIRGPQRVHAAGLLDSLLRSGYAGDLWLFDEIDSTNLEVDRLLAGGATAPVVVAARRQKAGRGRLGRTWDSDSEENVYLSVGLRPGCPADALSGFTLRVGVYLAESLNATVGGNDSGPVRLKWPNDLMLCDRKLGGILTEAKIEADSVRSLVVGVGINCGARPVGAGVAAASLSELGMEVDFGSATALSTIVVAIVSSIRRAATTLLAGTMRGEDDDDRDMLLPERFARLDHLAGKAVVVRRGARATHGIASGITTEGALRLRDESGNILAIHSGDATLAGDA